MPYTPTNNPYAVGDPYMYDLKWITEKMKTYEEPQKYADAAANSATEAANSATDAANSASAAENSKIIADQKANAAALSAQSASEYAAHIADPVSGIVTNWLENNITEDPTVIIDKSLNLVNAAAESKTVGNLMRKMDAFNFNLFNIATIEGNCYYANGKQTSNTHSASDYIPIEGGQTYVSARYPNGIKSIANPIIEWYDASKNYIGWTSSNTNVFTFANNARYCRISLPTNALKELAFIKCGSMGDMPDYLPSYQVEVPSLGSLPADVNYVKASLDRMSANNFNLFNKDTIENGCYYANGRQSNANFSASDFIPIIGGHTYTSVRFSDGVKVTTAPIIEWYDAAQNYIGWTSSNTSTITFPANAAFCKLSMQTVYIRNLVFLEKNSFAEMPDYEPAYKIELPAININANKDFIKYASGRFLNIGDSLTIGYYANQNVIHGCINENYPYFLGRMLSASVENKGINGGYPSRWLNDNPNFDYSPYDTIIIWLGTNGGLSVNDINVANTETKFYDTIIKNAKISNPMAKIILCKVFVTGEIHTGVAPYSVSDTNAAIDLLASNNGITDVIDLSGLNYTNHPELHSTADHTHFTKGGYLYIANIIKEYMINSYTINSVEFGLTSI